MMRKDDVLFMRLPSEMKARLAEAAKREMRTTSSLAVWILSKWLENNGFPAPKESEKASAPRKGKR